MIHAEKKLPQFLVLALIVVQPLLDVTSYWLNAGGAENTLTLILRLGLIAANPLICIHTLTPYTFPVIIPDSMEKSYDFSYFYARINKKESPPMQTPP